MGSGDRSRMVAACRTALARAGGGGRGVGRDTERAAHRDTGVSERRGGLSSTDASKEVGKRGWGGLEMEALGGGGEGGLENQAPGLLREKREAGVGSLKKWRAGGDSERWCLWAEVPAAEAATELGIRATFVRNPTSGKWEGDTGLGAVGAEWDEGPSMPFSLKPDPNFWRV